MPVRHTHEPGVCLLERIQALAASCDNEYYMSALGPPIGSRERAERGRKRIEQWIHELQTLRDEVKCPGCGQELEHQLALQREAIREIELVWGEQE